MEFKELKDKLITNVDKLLEIDKNEFGEKNKEKLLNFKNEVEKELNFKVLCLGDFSSGKTTFINNFFLEKEILPAKATPTTAKLTVVRYSNDEKVEVVSSEGTISIKDNVEKKLEELLTGNPDPKTIVYIHYPSKVLKEGIEVIDSPGLNDPDEERMELTYRIMDNVDCVLYFLTAHQAWKRSEKEFIEKRILGKRQLDKIIFVMTYWDLVDEDEREEIIDYVKECIKDSIKVAEKRLSEISDEDVKLSMPPLIPVSSKTGENFEELRKELWEYFNSIDKNKILQSKIRIFNSFIDDYIEHLKDREEGLSKKQEELEARLAKLQEEMDKYKNQIDDLRSRVENKVRLSYKQFISDLETIKYKALDLLENKIQRSLKKYEYKPERLSDEKFKAIVRNAINQSTVMIEREFIKLQRKFLYDIFELIQNEKSRLKLNQPLFRENISTIKKIEIEDIEFQDKKLTQTFIKAAGLTAAVGTAADGIGWLFLSSGIAGEGLLKLGLETFLGSGLQASLSLTGYLFFVGIAVSVGAFALNAYLKNQEIANFKKMILDLLQEIKEKFEEQIDEWIYSLQEEEDKIVNAVIKGIHNSVIESYNDKAKELKSIIELKEKGVSADIIENLKKNLELLKIKYGV